MEWSKNLPLSIDNCTDFSELRSHDLQVEEQDLGTLQWLANGQENTHRK